MKDYEVMLTCHAIISSEFAMMLNPKFRGPNFTWEEFPLRMAKMCQKNIFLYSPKTDSNNETLAYNYGKSVSEKLIKLMTEE